MAVFDAVMSPAVARGTKIAALGASTSSAEQVIGNNGMFLIVADGDMTMRFGTTGMSAADATDFYIPAKTTTMWDMSSQFTSFRVFNTTAGNINVYYLPISKF